MRTIATVCALWWLAMAAIAAEAPMKTRFGGVTVERSSPDTTLDTLAVDGHPVFIAEWEYITVYEVLALGEQDAVLFGVNCGGTGCPNDNLAFLVLGEERAPRVVKGDSFFSLDGTVEPRVENDKIIVDLGYENGNRKIAQFDLETISIRGEPRAVKPMSADSCRWLLDNAIPECIQAKAFDAACSNPRQHFSGVVERSLSAISNHPGFVAAGFDQACANACASGEAPPLPRYQATVCSIQQ